jgi:hypothetical protein
VIADKPEEVFLVHKLEPWAKYIEIEHRRYHGSCSHFVHTVLLITHDTCKTYEHTDLSHWSYFLFVCFACHIGDLGTSLTTSILTVVVTASATCHHWHNRYWMDQNTRKIIEEILEYHLDKISLHGIPLEGTLPLTKWSFTLSCLFVTLHNMYTDPISFSSMPDRWTVLPVHMFEVRDGIRCRCWLFCGHFYYFTLQIRTIFCEFCRNFSTNLLASRAFAHPIWFPSLVISHFLPYFLTKNTWIIPPILKL